MSARDDRAAVPADDGEPGARPAGLLAKLMTAVRPEFRGDVLVFDPRDPVFGGPPCTIAGCDRPQRERGMCRSHRRRWVQAGRPDPAEFAATTSTDWRGHLPVPSCQVAGCHYGGDGGHGLCKRHARQWQRAGCPEPAAWRGSQPPPATQPPACRVGYCDLWVRGTSTLCRTHHNRWIEQGRPDLEDFITSRDDPGPGAGERVDLRCLAPHLRLEVQYALQCRHDEQKARIFPAQLQPILRGLAAQQVSSMLDKPEHHWRQCPNPPRTGNGWRAFTLGTYDRIETLAFGQGWDIEYPRDTWRLRKLGIDRPAATISFGQITQPWLKSLAKRWARWQLTTGRSSGTAARAAAALSRFSQFLAAQPASIDGLAQVDRPLLEAYLAGLHTAVGGRKCHAQHLTALGGFLTAIRQHRWDDSALPASAMLFTEDYPRRAQGLPRALAAQVMAQLDRRDNLDRWDRPDYRLITMILMRCGLRISDACKIPSACLVTDADGAPYLRYFNRKMKREALVPIDGELHQLILQQQRRLERWPSQVPVLFPRPTTNLDGHKPVDGSTYRPALYKWLKLCDIRDEHGRPTKLVPHQWRHTLGTALINKDVPQEVVRRILDHDSHAMTAHYARLSDTTIRRHWDNARKVNATGEDVTLDPGGPLADAAWAKQRVSRATQALPNGYCGLPIQQSCPHANACLAPCPVFVTTAEFLPQHRAQHRATLQIITAAEAGGQTRVAEMNRQVATSLQSIITSLEKDEKEAPDKDENKTQEAQADAS